MVRELTRCAGAFILVCIHQRSFIHVQPSALVPCLSPPTRKFTDWPHFGVLSRRANTSLMPTLEIDKAAIDPAIAEVRDDATPTDFIMLGD